MTQSKKTRSYKAALAVALLAIAASLFAQVSQAATNDPYFARLWGLDRIGAEPAWGASKGSGVMIAIIDTGVDTNHPDLQGKLLPGYDFVSNDTDPRDENGHGTLMAGIAAALTGNKEGIASVAPEAKILPVRVFNGEGQGNSATVAEGIDYAMQEAANRDMSIVLNFSFVQESGATSGTSFFSDPHLDLAVRRAASEGAAVVIAAGNDGKNGTAYDSITQGIVVVGASDRNDARASLSNYGSGLDVLAPGIDITSTYWDKRTGRSVYAEASGTSTSVPFVSGAAALLMAKGMSGPAAVNHILGTARDLGTPGRDNDTGYGLLDVAAALGVSRQVPSSPAASPPPTRRVPTSPPKPPPSPSPSPSPSPLVLPSPGEPPEFQPPPSGRLDPPEGETRAAADGPLQSLPPPREAIAGTLVVLVTAMHVVRKTLL